MNAKKTKLFKRILFIIFTIGFVMLSTFYFFSNHYAYGNSTPIVNANSTSLGKISQSTVVEQTFLATEDFYGIAVLTATFDHTQYGLLEFLLVNDETGEVLFRQFKLMTDIKNNAYTTFATNECITVDDPTTYRIILKGYLVAPTYGSTAWITGSDLYADGELYINGVEQNADMCFSTVEDYQGGYYTFRYLQQVLLLLMVYAFLSLHCFLDIRKLYDSIYKYRWLIGALLLGFGVVNKLNGSSISQFDLYIQPGAGSGFILPLFGKSRAIRSDEWLVSVPRILSAEYTNYGLINDIVRGTETTNLSASGLFLNYSALAKPSDWGYYLFGSAYGLSFIWCFQVIFGFLFTFEFCQILTKKKRLLSLMGAIMIWFSIYNMFWSIVAWLFTGQAALVCFYYLTETKKTWQRILLGLSTAIFAADYAVNLYPAWQVPAGYVFAIILLWMIISQRKQLKQWKWYDWLICFVSVIFMLSLIVVYLYNDKAYLTEVSNTVYPGSRVDYGGFAWNKLLCSFSALLSPYKDFPNASELGCFYSLFPLSFLLYLYVFIRKKGKNLLMGMLILPTVMIGAYCTTALPAWMVKYSLLSYSTSARAADVLGYLSVLMLILALSEYESQKRIPWYIALVLSLLTSALTTKYSMMISDKKVLLFTLVIALLTTLIGTALFGKVKPFFTQAAMIVLSLMIFITGMSINPIMSGIDAITSKPVAKQIKTIVDSDPDAIWIDVDSIVLGNYLIACGARTLNSTNYVPNMEFWNTLYPNGENDEVYNRYAHLQIALSDTDSSVALQQADYIMLTLTYEQLEQFDVKYLYAIHELTSDTVDLDCIYSEYGSYIYQINYK